MDEFVFKEKWLIMLGKEYRIRNAADENSVLKKQKRIAKKTGRKPNLVLSLRNPE